MRTDTAPPTDVDVLIIGAGLSGIGAAYKLQRHRPGTRYAVLEARADLGGTWDLFRYPGVRSDSDLFTFGYDWKPWNSDDAIADGASIKAYIAEAARENGIDRHIRFQHKVIDANWSSADRHWIVRVLRTDTGEALVLRSSWIFAAAGYYRYDQGHTPEFEGVDRYTGQLVHPQHWPADLDYRGKRVVVIGSGATAVTLVPAMADQAAHVTLLQRTPSYVIPVPSKDPVARRLRPVLGARWSHAIARRFNIARQRWVYALSRRYPVRARRFIRGINLRMLGAQYPVDVHFNPPYAPWDQRLCVVPGGDLFKAIRNGKASMVTDRIASFTERGIALASGAVLEADIVVTATGLNLQPMGGLSLLVDGVPRPLSDTVAFKGMMLSGVPNLAFAIGYTSASWTLKVGLVCDHLCRLLDDMDARGVDVCTPVVDPAMATRPLLDFGAGYVQRSLDTLPRQGSAFPWAMSFDYATDAKMFRRGDVADPHLRFDPRRPVTRQAGAAEAVGA